MTDGFQILFLSPELIVVDKPHNVAMDGERQDVTVESWVHSNLRAFLAIPLPENASIVPGGGQPMMRDKRLRFVHQLDYATSGVLCLAFSRDMAAAVSHCFEMRSTSKEYVALVHGWIPQDVLTLHAGNDDGLGQVDEVGASVPCSFRRHIKDVTLRPKHGSLGGAVLSWPLAKDKTDGSGFRMRVCTSPEPEEDAQYALTVISLLHRGFVVGKRDDGSTVDVRCSMVHLRLYTGRTHQLRVHCAAFGFPIVGDHTYQSTLEAHTPGAGLCFPRMMLHAQALHLALDVVSYMKRTAAERSSGKRARRKETLYATESDQSETLHGSRFETTNRLAQYFQCSTT